MMAHKRFIIISILITQIWLTIMVGGTVGYLLDENKMNPVLKIGDQMFINKSEETVNSELLMLYASKIVLADQTIPLNLDKSQKRVASWVKEQYRDNSSQGIITGMLGYLNPYTMVKTYPETLFIDDEVAEQLKTAKAQLDKPPIPASLTYENNQLTIDPGQEGLSLNVEKTLQSISSTGQLNTVIFPVIDKVAPSPAAEDLTFVKDLIGDYTTYFNPLEVGRTTNIRLSAEALNGQLVPPNGVVSFNLEVGERAKEKGYLPADVYVDNSLARDYGGGVCQTASTLYQTVIQGNLELVERHRHTLPVDYVPSKGDATVAFGKLDFRFRNDTSSYMLISTETGADYVRVRLFAKADLQHPSIQRPGVFPEKFLDNPRHK